MPMNVGFGSPVLLVLLLRKLNKKKVGRVVSDWAKVSGVCVY